MKKKIFHLITSLNIGGTERFVEDVILGTGDRYEHHIGVIKDYGIIGQTLLKKGVIVVKVPGIFRIIKYIREFQPEIIHTHLYRANITGRIAGKILNVDVVSSRRSTDTWRKWYHVLLDNITSCWSRKIVVNSKCVADLLITSEKIVPENIEIIYTGIHDNWFIEAAAKDIKNTIGFVGRLHPEKGADFLPEVAAILKSRYPYMKVKIVGDGKLKGFLKKNLPDNCELAGWLDETGLRRFYDSVDLIVLLSRLESFPRVILEAGSRGIPAVAPDIGGIKEFIVDGITGLLYEKGDIVEACSKIDSFYRNTESNMSGKVLEAARLYQRKNMLSRIEKLYDSLM